MVEWYELEEDERVKKVYAKHTLEKFWKWWSRGHTAVMEIRIMDFTKIKLIKEKYGLPISSSGVYVSNVNDIKKVLKEVRDNTVLWFGVNPKKKSYNKKGYWGYSGEDYSIKEIGFIFIDIDRVTKIEPATNTELKNADFVANEILKRLDTVGWNKSYIKICSGHGVQLLIKLDDPIELPTPAINTTKKYQYDEKYDIMKDIVKKGIGAEIVKFARKFKDEYMVEVDTTGLNMGRVAALPYSKNFKYDTQRWRAIVELQDSINEGLTDYVYTKIKDLKKFKKNNAFAKSKPISNKNILTKGKMLNNPLVRFMLDNDLPTGNRHKYLVFALQTLIKDSGFTYEDKEVEQILSLIDAKYGGHIPRIVPGEGKHFEPDLVNKYCMDNLLPLVYEPWGDRKMNNFLIEEDVLWSDIISYPNLAYDLDDNKTLRDEIKLTIKKLIEGNIKHNTNVYKNFMRGHYKKYGLEKTKYLFDNKIVLKGLRRGVWFNDYKKS